ncbi:MAG: hypothetical protein JW876_01640 [Candidatus Krumholzibacteriota bacterium]|nr:hypothetical protein [Candidatus Krumholzibacteriota bacterium]
MRRVCIATAFLLLAAAAMSGAGEPALRGAGRALVAIGPDGCLGDGDGGLRWPGAGGTEFFGGGTVLVRWVDGGGRRVELRCDDLVPVPGIAADGTLCEGCDRGKRYPDRRCDDDGDGRIDEDPLDGQDNDGDGRIDEDFAAIGHDMVVVRARDEASGLVLSQRAYSWSFGHVRDFIGFTTTIENRAGAGRAAPAVVELALEIDLRLGDGDDPGRGMDDRVRYVGLDAEGEPAETGIRIVAVSDDGGFAAICPLDAVGPGGLRIGAAAVAAPRRRARELLRAEPGSRLARERERETVRLLRADGDRSPTGRLAVGGETETRDLAEGETTVLLSLDVVESFPPGTSVTLEWALVFGRTREALLSNVARAVETYRGTADREGTVHRWIVPARRAGRIEIEPGLATVWTRGQTIRAAALTLPAAVETEDVEWLGVDGDRTVSWERIGGKILVPIDDARVEAGSPFTVDGQLSDGTIFVARVGRDLLDDLGNKDASPDRLPDDALRLWPNPFRSSLNIDLQVEDPPVATGVSRGAGRGAGLSTVRIYDVQGRLVRAILDEEFLHPGAYSRMWDGLDETGAEVAPGVYYCTFRLGERSLTKRVILLR